MTKKATGHWGGDPNEHCGEIVLRAKLQKDARKLALLNRVWDDPEQFDRLFEALEHIEATAQAAADPVLS